MSTAADRPSSSHRYFITALTLLITSCGGAIRADEAERIAETLRLETGTRVADVAGDSEWTEELARRVGETGRRRRCAPA